MGTRRLRRPRLTVIVSRLAAAPWPIPQVRSQHEHGAPECDLQLAPRRRPIGEPTAMIGEIA